MTLRQQGMVRGGTDACAIVGYGDRWYEPQRVRFMDDEPVRHKMLDLIVSVACRFSALMGQGRGGGQLTMHTHLGYCCASNLQALRCSGFCVYYPGLYLVALLAHQ